MSVQKAVYDMGLFITLTGRKAEIKINISYVFLRVVLPNRCSIKENDMQCPNPPEFIVTITSDDAGEYMLGVTCERHKQAVLVGVSKLQRSGRAVDGRVGFTPVRPVGTDCIRSDPDEFIHISPAGTLARTDDSSRWN